MATKAQLMAQAKIHNAEVEIDHDAGIAYVYSPSGFYWSEGGTHVLAESFSNTSQSWKPEAYADLIERMMCGLSKCNEPNCDMCEEAKA